MCFKLGGKCVTTVEGYYILTTVGTLIGIAWYFVFQKRFRGLQSIKKSAWHVYKTKEHHHHHNNHHNDHEMQEKIQQAD